MEDEDGAKRVMEFITTNRLDERAAEALLACPEHIQRTVVARGDLHGMNNPSSAVLGRIRQVKMRAESEALRMGGAFGYGEAQVDEFISNNTLDDRAADLLRNSSPEVQYAVMSRGDLHDARNPSSAVLGRIKEAQAKGIGRGGYGVMQRAVDDVMVNTVRVFVQQNNLDERAQDALMNSAPDVVNAVIARGSLDNAKNPSSAVLGRIKDAKAAGFGQAEAQMMAGAGAYQQGYMLQGAQTLEQEVEFFIENGGVDERAAQAFRCCEDGVKRFVMDKGSVRDARNPSSALLARIKDGNSKLFDGQIQHAGANWTTATQQMGWQMQAWSPKSSASHEQELDAFIKGSGVDDRAAEALMCQTVEVQMAVMARGSLQDARNPSSAILGRIKDANAELSVYGTTNMHGSGGQWTTQPLAASAMIPNPVEEFCREANLDDRAMEALTSSPQEVQAMVLAGGGLQTARNPSSAVLGRIKEAQQKLGITNMGTGSSQGQKFDFSAASASAAWVPFSTATTVEQQVEEFIANNAIDERAAEAFRFCKSEIAQAVMARGDLHDARNPSAALLGRIRDSQSSAGGGSGSTFQAMSSVATSMHAGSMSQTSSGDLENFIMENGLDDRAAELLRATTPEVQAAVLARGGLQDARNPSSAVLGRIKDAQMSHKQQYVQPQSDLGSSSAYGAVDSFIQEYGIDDRAADALRAAAPAIQQAVLARGGLQDARNPSSAVLGRLRDAQASYSGGGKGSRSGGGSRFQPY